ncbi:hypothetical protein GCM10027596_40650 [Nocardioides korecus]
MVDVSSEQYFPLSPAACFRALHAVTARLFTLRGVDAFARSVAFSTPMSAFSWGAHMNAQVVPALAGAYVRVGGASKMARNVTAKGTESKNGRGAAIGDPRPISYPTCVVRAASGTCERQWSLVGPVGRVSVN